MRTIFFQPGRRRTHSFLTRRRIRNKELVRKLEDAAKPPVCPACGVEAYFHWCEKFGPIDN